MQGRTLNRIQPNLQVQAYETFGIAAPRATHQRKVTCQEVDCQAYVRGWATTLHTALQPETVQYIRSGSSDRRFVEEAAEDGMVRFVFAPGQRCFREHFVSLDRPPVHYSFRGDHRRRLGGVRRFDRGRQWVEEFAETQDRIATKLGRS